MDVDSIADTLGRNKRKLVSSTRPIIPNSVLKIVTRYVIFLEKRNFIIPDSLALELHIPVHIIGHAIQELVAQGLLCRGILNIDIGDYVLYGNKSIYWTGSKWIQTKKKPNLRREIYGKPYYHYRDMFHTFGLGEKASKKETAEWVRKNQDLVVEWNGQVYYIEVGKNPYSKLREELGLCANPFVPWFCPKCKKKCSENQDVCYKCEIKRNPGDNKKLEAVQDKKPARCSRCNGLIATRARHGKKRNDHGLKKCNVELVRGIMSE